MDDQAYRAIITKLIEAYPDTQTPDTARLLVYRQTLSGLPADTLAAAVAVAIGELKWFPTVAEIRDYARQHLELTGALPPAGVAWSAAVRACNGYVPRVRETVTYPNRAIEEVVRRMGGPRTIAHCEIAELEWKRKEFLQLYAEVSMQAEILGASLGTGTPRYRLIYGGYTTVNGEYTGIGESRAFDTWTGQVVAPEFLEVQELQDAKSRRGGVLGPGTVDPGGARHTGGARDGGSDTGDLPGLPGWDDHYRTV